MQAALRERGKHRGWKLVGGKTGDCLSKRGERRTLKTKVEMERQAKRKTARQREMDTGGNSQVIYLQAS